MSGTEDLILWLRGVLDEDERAFRYNRDADDPRSDWVADLADVAAKRAILEPHRPAVDSSWPEPGHCIECWDVSTEDYRPWPCPTLRLLASAYSTRPGYRDEWRPDQHDGRGEPT